MSEFENKVEVNPDEVDAAELVARAQEEDREEVGGGRERRKILESAECSGEDALYREVLRGIRAARSRRRWACVGLAMLSAATVASCAAALMTGRWQEMVYSIGIVYLAMTAVWLAEGWKV